MALARSVQVAPTIFYGLRLPQTTTTYSKDGLVATAVSTPPYIAEDHALLLGLATYEGTLCNCGYPRAVAWHSDMDGWFEGEAYVCHACTARARASDPDHAPVAYGLAHDELPHDHPPLAPFVLGHTTSSP